MNKYILDTHALIWYLEGSPKLGNSAKDVMDESTSNLILPMIALAEAIDIVDKGRTKISSVADLLNDVYQEKRVQIYPLTLAVLKQKALLPEPFLRCTTG